MQQRRKERARLRRALHMNQRAVHHSIARGESALHYAQPAMSVEHVLRTCLGLGHVPLCVFVIVFM